MTKAVDTMLTNARAAERRGDPVAAQHAYVEVLERYPGNVRARGALAALDQALTPTYQACSPPYPYLAKLVAHFQDGALDEAAALGGQLLTTHPQSHFLINLNGAIADALGLRDLAIAAYLKALSIKPDYVDAHYNLAMAYEAIGEQHKALGFYHRAIALRPDHAPALARLGWLYTQRRNYDEAIAAFERALALNPGEVSALDGIAESQHQQGLLAPAIATYERVIALAPAREDLRVALESVRAMAGDWSSHPAMDAVCAVGLNGQSVPNFPLLGIDPDPAHALIRARTAAAAIVSEVGEVAPLTIPAQAADGRIRIGYFSADFHDHATMFLMQGTFREHDRARFAIHAYSFGANRSGDRRQALQGAVDSFTDVRDMSDAAITALAREHGLDLAVDLKGYTAHRRTRLFARRLAPVQAQWLGYPGTMGADFIDYIVADGVIIPADARTHYSEAVIRLPGSYQPNDNQRAIAATLSTRADYGLPETGLVFCSFNQVWKISPKEFDVWMDLLREVPGSVLWLFRSNPLAGSNLQREVAARGVAPERLVLAEPLEHAEHLARLRHADLFLDCFTYGAHTTASDALWAGVPVLTCAGPAFPARVAASLLTAAGLPELVTHSREDYAALALALARDPARLADVRARLAAQRATCVLFDTVAHTRALERAWTTIVERSRAGLAPVDIDV
ncbi:tetratricopeptide repeat protein [Novosphingobium sp. Chol11]|uniref:O-linked N-acetylglucosamine transferase, SPINDLY family protein n=1 Tax=Novosphingobium sp. Chol11 TaxID=1385763 RepID=UPI0025D05473|nr:tetratricopeptide repeat protein [Novosphingobium sp. Chol11]